MDDFKIGDTICYDGIRYVITALSDGEYGTRVTFTRGLVTITTTPGLDPRYSPCEEHHVANKKIRRK
jgi:hypothetical protein